MVASVFNLSWGVAGLEMAHLPAIISSFQFVVLTLTVPGLKPPQISKSFVLFE
jgi:hypothetical protein